VGGYIVEIASQMRAYARRFTSIAIDPASNDWALVAAALIKTRSVDSPHKLKSFGRAALERLGTLTAEGKTAATASDLAAQIKQRGRVSQGELLSLVENAGRNGGSQA
jgi:hypothetical protein